MKAALLATLGTLSILAAFITFIYLYVTYERFVKYFWLTFLGALVLIVVCWILAPIWCAIYEYFDN